ncbi:flagellar hook-length control protein FliK [Falsirhodobacter deserti]|uniref:flagellar hook-length control protein FliK n=1 Tax=Falsirhodobacter deserti TaxID=1365611 RepID=UPI000FE3FD36|nr:flagellar hook-length control protein FliK [Falsirhodobacter deserti]
MHVLNISNGLPSLQPAAALVAPVLPVAPFTLDLPKGAIVLPQPEAALPLAEGEVPAATEMLAKTEPAPDTHLTPEGEGILDALAVEPDALGPAKMPAKPDATLPAALPDQGMPETTAEPEAPAGPAPAIADGPVTTIPRKAEPVANKAEAAEPEEVSADAEATDTPPAAVSLSEMVWRLPEQQASPESPTRRTVMQGAAPVPSGPAVMTPPDPVQPDPVQAETKAAKADMPVPDVEGPAPTPVGTAVQPDALQTQDAPPPPDEMAGRKAEAPPPPAAPGPETSAQDAPRRAAAEVVQDSLQRLVQKDSAEDHQGRVQVTLHREGEDWRVVVSADNPETLDLMRRHADMLQQDLARQGFAGAQLDFSEWVDGEQDAQEQQQQDAPPLKAGSATYVARTGPSESTGLDLRL